MIDHPRIPSSPLVSILLPCYNGAETLPEAIGSILAQTYENWEAVVVDDGSTDETPEVVNGVGDPRIRYIRQPRNMGRGAARQRALGAAQGVYLSMVDADDWIYPDKLALQVAAMEAHPELVLVSCGMAVLDGTDALVGVRSHASEALTVRVFDRPQRLGVSFPASMIRREEAQATGFDTSFRFTEDADFLLRLMMGRPYGVLADVAYAYTEHSSMSLEKMKESYRYGRRAFRKHFAMYPVATVRALALSYARDGVYRCAYAMGQEQRLINRRYVAPSNREQARFEAVRARVAAEADRVRAASTLVAA